MKILRNPIAVAVLAVLAGIYSLWTIFGARGLRSLIATAATTTATGPAVPVPPPSASPPPPTPPVSPTSMIRPAIVSQANRWLDSPRRDPFRILVPTSTPPAGPQASERLTLHAIWRQSGSKLAILNQEIVREGASLEGFDIESIEADAVWVRGTNGHGRERLVFATPHPEASEPTQTDPALLQAPTRETITATIPVAPTQ